MLDKLRSDCIIEENRCCRGSGGDLDEARSKYDVEGANTVFPPKLQE
jgi:hypothetical protein